MTFEELVVLMALAGLLVAWGASALGIRPLWIFVAACVPSAFVLAAADRELNRSCGGAAAAGVSVSMVEIGLVLALVLWAAAGVAGVIEGVQLSKAGERDAALARYLGCPLAAAFGGGTVFVMALSAALHCLD